MREETRRNEARRQKRTHEKYGKLVIQERFKERLLMGKLKRSMFSSFTQMKNIECFKT